MPPMIIKFLFIGPSVISEEKIAMEIYRYKKIGLKLL